MGVGVPRSGDRGDAVMGDRVVGSWGARTLKLGGGPCDGGGLAPPWILLPLPHPCPLPSPFRSVAPQGYVT